LEIFTDAQPALSKTLEAGEHMYSVVCNNMLQTVLSGLLLLHVEIIARFVHKARKLLVLVQFAQQL